jgi:predicted PurR-regulated permease PerM
LFGVLGLTLADPMTAVIKAGLEHRSEREQDDATPSPAQGDES